MFATRQITRHSTVCGASRSLAPHLARARRPRRRAVALPSTAPPSHEGPGSGGATGSSVPDEVVGQWYAGGVSPTDFYNPNTGHWTGNGYGSGLSFTFESDGSYVRAFQMYSNLYDCGTLTFTYEKGTVRVDAASSTLELHPSSATIHEQNSCSGWSDSRPIPVEGTRIHYQRGTDDQGATTLWMREDDTEWTPFHPQEWYN
jgi:hypothetical protein